MGPEQKQPEEKIDDFSLDEEIDLPRITQFQGKIRDEICKTAEPQSEENLSEETLDAIFS